MKRVIVDFMKHIPTMEFKPSVVLPWYAILQILGGENHPHLKRCGQMPVRLSFPLSKTFAKAEWPTTSSRNLKDIKITTLEMEGREIAPNTSANATQFFTMTTKL